MVLNGTEVIEALAARFPQLYVEPAEDAQAAHRLASGRGIAPEGAGLGHFARSEYDELREVDTPAGPIEVVFLKERADFETFLQIISHKSQPVPIARTVGAITYRGLADWGKVAAARAAYQESGDSDWDAEFSRLAKDPVAFRSEIIVISDGSYSNMPAESTPYGASEWQRLSREIRLHHECAHVVCRRLMPGDVLPVWDEITADMVGLLCATGSYDAALAARFLGVTDVGFVGGRIDEYLDEEQLARIDEIAAEVHGACTRLEELTAELEAADVFDELLRQKRAPLLAY